MTPPRRTGPRGKVIHPSILGPYLQRVRAQTGLTQEQVADAAGIGRSVYNRYERSRGGMEVDKAPALAAALNVEAVEIESLADQPGVVAELAVQVMDLRERVAKLEGA